MLKRHRSGGMGYVASYILALGGGGGGWNEEPYDGVIPIYFRVHHDKCFPRVRASVWNSG